MRLSKLKLAGFKSFVDPTTVNLPSNLIGIVGPNGCGKSNIIDAVRWVLGESSAKHLRGDSMADVIFSGSNTRKPIGQASIELVFDNSDGTITGNFANYNEISIKRQVSRDGISNYYLNNARCRRRDITDILLGTGLGPNSYAIIEQGMISRVIEAKPEELRKYLEEAAGISKYKERRRETENRIRHTRENLDRVNDLREEIEKQLAHLQRQSKIAGKYKQLKEEERLAKAQLLALRWAGLNDQANEFERKIAEQGNALEAQVAVQRRIEAETEKQREAHVAATEAFNKVQEGFYSVGAEIARNEQGIKHAKERRSQLQQDLEQLELDQAESHQHLETDTQRITELTASLQEVDPEYQQLADRENASAETLAAAEQDMQNWQQAWEQFTHRHAEASRVSQVEEKHIEHLEQQLQHMHERLARFETEEKALSSDEVAQEISRISQQISEHESGLVKLQTQLQEKLADIGEQRKTNNDLSSQLDESRSELQSLVGRHASLEALQQAALGKSGGAVNEWLDRQGLTGLPRLAEGLEVEAGWERAVETVMGASLEAICIDGMDPVLSVLSEFDHGVLGIIDTSSTSGPADRGANTLLSKVSSALPVGGMLSGVYIADNLQQALGIRNTLGANESVVTPDGIWMGRSWLRVSRDPDEKAGVLQREQELKQLGDELKQLRNNTRELEQRLDEGHALLQDLEEQRDNMQNRISEANQQYAEVKARLGGREARLEHVTSRTTDIKKEAEELRQLVSRDTTKLSEARQRLQDVQANLKTLETERLQLSAQRDDNQAALDAAREQARTDHDAAHQLALKVESMRSSLESTRENMTRMQNRLQQLNNRREELQTSLAQGETPIEQMKTELEVLLARRVDIETQLATARARVEDIDTAMQQLAEERNEAEQKVQDIRGGLESERMRWQEINVRRQTLDEQILESGHELKQLQDEMPEGATEIDWTEKVEKLSQRILRLGPINLAAIDEYSEQSERKVHLDEQYKDITDALETLENAIRKIDRETRTRFKETYDKVNSGVQKLFPRLFGGGHAYLELTGDDLLDTGITIMARPPGKRISSIHLLSGGEKALTAVSLVFAIFELNPAPFCLLDEVDAPLDDANVGRFCELVKERSNNIQFMFITHNKLTMEIANQLLGVTMHEPGVSRLVAVDVDEAVELVAV